MPKYQFSCEVVPQYIPEQSSPADSVYVDANGLQEEVKGLAVVGHQPLLRPGESFQYTSGSRLRTVSGTMHGSYFCVAEDGERFECEIPMFVLDSQLGTNHHRVLH